MLSRNGRALDQPQQVTLHDLSRYIGANTPIAGADLVDLVEENNAVVLNRADRFLYQLVLVQQLVGLLVNQDLVGLLDSDAPGLSATSSEFAENVAYRDCAHLGPRDPGDLEHRHAARRLYLNIDLFFVELARAQLLAKTVARRRAGVGAHQRIEHALLCGEMRARRHVLALALPGLDDCGFHEITHDLFNVASHVADLGELGRLHLDERGTRQPGEPARDLGFAYAGWSN